MKKLQYWSNEVENKVVLFITIEDDWENQQIELSLNSEDLLQVACAGQVWVSDKLPESIYESLAYEYTRVMFCESEQVVNLMILNPCRKKKRDVQAG